MEKRGVRLEEKGREKENGGRGEKAIENEDENEEKKEGRNDDLLMIDLVGYWIFRFSQ